MRPSERVVVLGNEAEPLVVGVEEHAARRPCVSNAISLGTPAASSARVHWIAVRVAKRGIEQRLELLAVLGARGTRREPGVVGELGHAERRAQARPVLVFDRRDLDPALLGLVQAVARRRCRSAPGRAGAAARRRRRRATRRTRTSRRRRAATSTAPGPRRSRAGGRARRGSRPPTASRWRCRSSRSGSRSARCPRAPGPARTRARPTPGTAGRGRRSARAGLRARTPTCCSRRCRG